MNTLSVTKVTSPSFFYLGKEMHEKQKIPLNNLQNINVCDTIKMYKNQLKRLTKMKYSAIISYRQTDRQSYSAVIFARNKLNI